MRWYLIMASLAALCGNSLLFDVSNSLIDTELKLVQILFRHGDRTPIASYPSDPYNETIWAKYGGYGQLTQLGMQQHNQFGQFLRYRYATFLSQFYDHNRVFIRSTNYDRTLMSAYSMLSGLFAPKDYQIWNERINWQPVPVHTTNEDTDTIFYSKNCPKYVDLKKQIQQSDEFIYITKQYQKMLDILDKKSGYTNVTLDNLWRVGDTLFIEKTHELPLPEWAEENYETIKGALKWGFYFDFRTTEMAKLIAGGILRDMKINIDKKVFNNTPNELYLYSGHDTYVAALSKLLNITDEINQPPYVSSVILELRKQTNSPHYFISVYLKNNTASQPIVLQPLTIYGCDFMCPLEKFNQIVSSLIVDDFSKECQQTVIEINLVFYTVLGVFLTIASVLILFCLLFKFDLVKFKSESDIKYQRLDLNSNSA